MWRLVMAEVWANFWSAPQRTLLALFAMTIGSGAVVALLEVGTLAEAESLRRFRALGTDLLVIQSAPPLTGEPVDIQLDDVDALRGAIPALSAVSPLAITGGVVKFAGTQVHGNLVGAEETLGNVVEISLETGRRFTPYDRAAMAALLGHTLANALSAGKRPIQPGDVIEVDGRALTVYGILRYRPTNLLLPVDFNNSLIAPIASVIRVTGRPALSAVLAKVDAKTVPTVASRLVKEWFHSLRRPKAVDVRSADQMIESVSEQTHLYADMLATIGGIALLIGAASITNVMLAAVSERKAEIGIRLALGARQIDIQILFLAEAVLLSIVGASGGIASGLIAAGVLAYFANWAFAVNGVSVLLGGASGVLVGVLAGVLPAVRAAKLDPIAALRTD